jgi:hypothetical protein
MKIFDTSLSGNRESGRHGNLQIGHFGQSRPFPSQEFFHIPGPFGFASAKEIDIFFVPHFFALLYKTHRPLGENDVMTEEGPLTGTLSGPVLPFMGKFPRVTVHFLKKA